MASRRHGCREYRGDLCAGDGRFAVGKAHLTSYRF
jgi:hypothetical protein